MKYQKQQTSYIILHSDIIKHNVSARQP